MAKMSLSWHQKCLKNQEATLRYQLAKLERLAAEVDEAKVKIAVYRGQIVRAIEEGIEAFDAERFSVNRPAKRRTPL